MSPFPFPQVSGSMRDSLMINQRAVDIGQIVKEDYDINDGADLAFNLIERGIITMSMSLTDAARFVAQHIEQA